MKWEVVLERGEGTCWALEKELASLADVPSHRQQATNNQVSSSFFFLPFTCSWAKGNDDGHQTSTGTHWPFHHGNRFDTHRLCLSCGGHHRHLGRRSQELAAVSIQFALSLLQRWAGSRIDLLRG